MEITKGTWRMCKRCMPGSLSFSSPVQEPGNEVILSFVTLSVHWSLVGQCFIHLGGGIVDACRGLSWYTC